MGNCVFRGTCELSNNRSLSETTTLIKVMTTNGRIMEYIPPITAECITSEFPNHAIFTNQNPNPLFHNDHLILGHSYYLLPIKKPAHPCYDQITVLPTKPVDTKRVNMAPYRMSLDSHGQYRDRRHKERRWSSSDGSGMEITSLTPRSATRNGGVWKVKLVISLEQLSDILAHDAKTEELVENLRSVAKCGNGIVGLIAADSESSSIVSTATNNLIHQGFSRV